MTFAEEVESLIKQEKLPSFVATLLLMFHESYLNAIQGRFSIEEVEPRIFQLLHFTIKQIHHPYRFELYHRKIVQPFNYYKFGLDIIRPLIDFQHSSLINPHILIRIEEQIQRNENVILLANHQVEPDPQIISLLLEQNHPKLAEDLVFIAGHRVISDPLAVPFSLGRNLICIYSKKHIAHPPEQKAFKLIHNQRSMKKMAELLSEGGKCIYVAPSGGRDRPNENGEIFPAKFDPQSLEMLLLMTKKAKRPSHFYPLALSTYHILPPPHKVEKDIGEKRLPAFAPVHLHFDEEKDLDAIVADIANKLEKRVKRAEIFSEIIREAYLKFN